VVVIVPVDRDEDEREDVDEQGPALPSERLERRPVGWPQPEREDRDDHGHHRVAERLEAAGAHRLRSLLLLLGWVFVTHESIRNSAWAER
jgi:hypothetical protein